MKRDWKILEEIMTAIEENKVRIHWEELPVEQHSVVLLHYELLQESGLIVNYELVSDMTDDGTIIRHPNFLPQMPDCPGIRLTMKGYDFLEVVRDKKLWNGILTKAKTLGVKVTFEFIKQAIPVLYSKMF